MLNNMILLKVPFFVCMYYNHAWLNLHILEVAMYYQSDIMLYVNSLILQCEHAI